MKNNQTGRSMIEMLGVLAVVGVLSVGGLEMATKARQNSQTTELIGGVSQMATTLKQNRKHASDIVSGYGGDCIKFLKQIGKLPAGFTYNSSTGALDTKIGASVTSDCGSADFTLIISGANRDVCVKAASNVWGDTHSNGFFNVSVGSKSGKTISIADAANACGAATSISLSYKF